jgi:hypothetical protein
MGLLLFKLNLSLRKHFAIFRFWESQKSGSAGFLDDEKLRSMSVMLPPNLSSWQVIDGKVL